MCGGWEKNRAGRIGALPRAPRHWATLCAQRQSKDRTKDRALGRIRSCGQPPGGATIRRRVLTPPGPDRKHSLFYEIYRGLYVPHVGKLCPPGWVGMGVRARASGACVSVLVAACRRSAKASEWLGGNHGWVNRPVGLVSVAVSVEGVSEGKGE